MTIDDLTDPTARVLLRQVESLGFKVVLFRLPGSLLGTVPPRVEIQAVKPTTGEQYIAVVEKGYPINEYKGAFKLAEAAGVRVGVEEE